MRPNSSLLLKSPYILGFCFFAFIICYLFLNFFGTGFLIGCENTLLAVCGFRFVTVAWLGLLLFVEMTSPPADLMSFTVVVLTLLCGTFLHKEHRSNPALLS